MRHIGDDERRARLAVRHGLLEPVLDTLAATRAMTCLHATEPASVHLAAWARSGATRDEVDAALYDDRSIVKQLAMRRTVFAFPRELLPAVWGSASARVAGQQARQLAKEAQAAGIARDGMPWAEAQVERVRTLITDEGPLATSQVRERLPDLDARITRGRGTYQADVAIARQVITALAAAGQVCRGANDGGWKLSRPRWTSTPQWLGEELEATSEADGYAALATAWLRTFGPGTEVDLVWWLGATKSAVRAALAAVGAVEVSLDAGATGWVLPDDVDPVASPGHWAALLPALDPTTMGWKERGFHLGDHAERIFDRNGNGGPTAWWDGRIVGVWCQRDDGEVLVVPAEPLSAAAHRALDAKAGELSAWLGGDVVRSIYLSPLAREHLASLDVGRLA